MSAIQNTIYFAIFLGVLVTVHELGHFLAAKWAGVKVLKFSIGFGPKVFGIRRGETEYQLAALPLGGFVSMAGQHPGEEVDPQDEGRTFTSAPWWKRMIILSAGPAFNLLFPIVAYFFVFVGDHQVVSSRVGSVEPGSPAAVAGVQPGDLITSVNGVPIRTFEEIRGALDNTFDRSVPVTVDRDGQVVTLHITPVRVMDSSGVEKVQRGQLGVSSVPRPAVIGVLPGSAAARAGLATFDRVLTVNGEVVRDDVRLRRALTSGTGPLTVEVIRSELLDVGGAAVVNPTLATVTLERSAGAGLAELGLESADLYLWTVQPGSPADAAGLRRGDRLLSLDGAPLPSYLKVQNALQQLERTPFELTWRRADGSEGKATLAQVPEEAFDELKNRSEVLEIGFRPRPAFRGNEILAAGPDAELVTVHRGPLEALGAAVKTVPEGIRQIALAMRKLVTREIPLESVGGPILLFQVAAKSAEAGYESFLRNMALVSVNLALVNLLPIPILDGFGLIAAAWEGIRRRPIPVRAREYANMVGLAVLALLMILVFKNDITKTFFR